VQSKEPLKLKKNKFIANVGIVSLGPIIVSLLGFFAEPWISRMWGPDLKKRRKGMKSKVKKKKQSKKEIKQRKY